MRQLILLNIFLLSLTSCYNIKDNNKQEYTPELINLNGYEFSIDSYKGNVVFLNLWATWCKPCIAEFEDISKAKKLFQNDSIKFIAISNESLNTIESFVKNNKYEIEFLKLNGDYSLYQAYGLPTTIIYDKFGKEAFRTSGMKKNQFTSNNFVNKIKKLL